MRITDALLAEHGVITGFLDHVGRNAPGWSPGQARTVAATLAAVLRPHAAVEDEHLFPAVERALGHEPTPLAVLRLEHEEIEAVFADVASAPASAELAPRLVRLVKLIGDHIAKEEGILFPLAEHRLDEDALQRLGARWSASRRAEVEGPPPGE